jgi:excisionase family DNA binding protein
MGSNGTHGAARDLMLTPTELAEQLKVSRSSIYRWTRDGTIPSIRIAGTTRIPARLLIDRIARSARG